MRMNTVAFVACSRGVQRAACAALLCIACAGAAWAADIPGIAPIALTTVPTEQAAFPPEMRVGDFDGTYRELIAFKAQTASGGRVGFWESKAGTLRSLGYPQDEFVYVITGNLETTDDNGTVRQFGPGDTFVLPKGWVGVWNMKTDFKKVFVNF